MTYKEFHDEFLNTPYLDEYKKQDSYIKDLYQYGCLYPIASDIRTKELVSCRNSNLTIKECSVEEYIETKNLCMKAKKLKEIDEKLDLIKRDFNNDIWRIFKKFRKRTIKFRIYIKVNRTENIINFFLDKNCSDCLFRIVKNGKFVIKTISFAEYIHGNDWNIVEESDLNDEIYEKMLKAARNMKAKVKKYEIKLKIDEINKDFVWILMI